MSKIIKFPKREQKISEELRALIRMSDEFDEIIIRNLEKGHNVRDVAGIIAHRLGTLLNTQSDDDKVQLLRLVTRILRNRSGTL